MNTNFDAIVVGSGISGGWAAKELCESGLKTLVLERGRDVKHITDYPTATKNPWDFKHRLFKNKKDKEASPIQSKLYQFDEGNKHFFINDNDHPYIQEDPFYWIRGHQVGGKSLLWGRQCYRWSDLDFEANLKDGVAVDWPIRYDDIKDWYEYVEKFVGISGKKANLSQLPDSHFLPPVPLNCMESHFSEEVSKNYTDRQVIPIRLANLTSGKEGRGPCQYRNLCSRGCIYGGYFSSNSATIPAAEATGNLTLRPHSIVREIIYDPDSGKAKGVRVIDTKSKKTMEFYARVIFLNASTIATASILLNSKSEYFPNGFGNSSGELGHNLMDHLSTSGTVGEFDKFEDMYYSGRNPGGIYVPRFTNLKGSSQPLPFNRGYSMHGKAYRKSWHNNNTQGFGKNFKKELTTPGKWQIWLGATCETLPNHSNRIELDNMMKDQWGIPLVKVHFQFGANDLAMKEEAIKETEKMLKRAGASAMRTFQSDRIPGTTVHEMGTARMGRDPKTSVLNGFNQMHDVKNVFVTDGSCMTSSACQNPSLTYMALTARACNHAVGLIKEGKL